jgi:RNA polymerase sigma-70 factor (ECF subfamily)
VTTHRSRPDQPAPVADHDDPAAESWLVDKARGGNVDAFEVLVRRHRTRVYRIALRILGDPQDAQDVTQDVFIQVWVSLAAFLGGSAFTTWLYRITVNRSLNHRQRRRDTFPLPEYDPPADADPADVVIARHRAKATARVIASLPADQRAVFVLHQMEGFSYPEVAAILRLPEPTVRGRLARARRSLFDQLGDWT